MRGAAGGVLMVSGEGARSWSCLREAGAIEMTKQGGLVGHVGPAKSGCASDSSQAWAKRGRDVVLVACGQWLGRLYLLWPHGASLLTAVSVIPTPALVMVVIPLWSLVVYITNSHMATDGATQG